MKFKELLQKVPFEVIVPELDRYFRSLGYKQNEVKKKLYSGLQTSLRYLDAHGARAD